MMRLLITGLLLIPLGCCGYGLWVTPELASNGFDTPEDLFAEYFDATAEMDWDRMLRCLEYSDRGPQARIMELVTTRAAVLVATGDCIEDKYGAALANRWRDQYLLDSKAPSWNQMQRDGAKVVQVGTDQASVVFRGGEEPAYMAKAIGPDRRWYIVLEDITCRQIWVAVETHKIILKKDRALEKEIRVGKFGPQEIEQLLVVPIEEGKGGA